MGPLGCFRSVCSDGHGTRPGVRVAGFLGGNIRGFVELGLAGGWGTLTPEVDEGTNALALYGLDAAVLQNTLFGQLGPFLDFNLGDLAITGSTKLRAAQVGPVARIHFVPRGRVTAFAGGGIQYNLFGARYETLAGDLDMDFHGLAVPIEAGFGVYVHRNVAIMTQFDYLWTWYGLAVIDHPEQRLALPMGALQSAARDQGVDLRGELPQFWTVSLGIRGRV